MTTITSSSDYIARRNASLASIDEELPTRLSFEASPNSIEEGHLPTLGRIRYVTGQGTPVHVEVSRSAMVALNYVLSTAPEDSLYLVLDTFMDGLQHGMQSTPVE